MCITLAYWKPGNLESIVYVTMRAPWILYICRFYTYEDVHTTAQQSPFFFHFQPSRSTSLPQVLSTLVVPGRQNQLEMGVKAKVGSRAAFGSGCKGTLVVRFLECQLFKRETSKTMHLIEVSIYIHMDNLHCIYILLFIIYIFASILIHGKSKSISLLHL